MTNLRHLNVKGNDRLTRLPVQLATCDSLTAIDCDWDVIVEPPPSIVLAEGTLGVLRYLMTSANGSEPAEISSEFKMDTTRETVDFVLREKKEVTKIMDNRLAKEMVKCLFYIKFKKQLFVSVYRLIVRI